MKYENSECVQVHAGVGPHAYEINLIIKPTDDNATIHMQPFIDILDKFFIDDDLQKHLCLVNIMAAEKNFFLNKSGFKIALYARLCVNEMHNRKQYIKQFMHTFKLKFSNISHLFDVEISGQSFVRLFYSSPFVEYPLYTFRTPMYDENWYLVKEGKTDKLNNRCRAQYPLSIIAPVTLCPRITIHKNQVRVVVSDFTLCFVEFGFCVKSENFIESVNGTQVEVCVDEYLRGVSDVTGRPRVSLTEEKILSAVCVSLSSAGCAVSLFTFIKFDEGKHLRGLNLISTTVNLFIANVFYFLSGVSAFSPLFCRVVGALNHFSWLAVVTWMSVSCFSIFRTFTSIQLTKKDGQNLRQSFLWNSFYSFLVPLSMVSVNMLVSSFWFHDDNYGYSPDTCYISEPKMILYTFAIPVAVLIVLNIFMVIITAREINARNSYLENDSRMIFVYCRLSTLTGASWVFGFFHMIFQVQIFSLLQILITGSQGLFIFFAFAAQLILKRFWLRDDENKKKSKSSSILF